MASWSISDGCANAIANFLGRETEEMLRIKL